MSIIAKCAFGMTIDNLGAENDPFIKKAKLLSDPPGFSSPFVLLLCTYFIKESFCNLENFELKKSMFDCSHSSKQTVGLDG